MRVPIEAMRSLGTGKKFTLATVAGIFKGTVFSKKYMGYHIVAKGEQLST
jgi:hypothetical protein